MEKIL